MQFLNAVHLNFPSACKSYYEEVRNAKSASNSLDEEGRVLKIKYI